jgi:pimeloyl-ACP methyl ester carboxylesterase
VAQRAQSIQFLIHGATGNKLYWSALAPDGQGYQPFNYSWVEFARQQGYHTLAIDRLGCGNSSRPDPTLVRTSPEVETVSQILGILHGENRTREGYLSFLPPSFSTIILNGFSYGSLVIDNFLNNPPSPSMIALVNATILTGYTHVPNAHPDPNVTAATQQFSPAAQIFPTRFDGLDPGYRTIANAPNYAHSFFAGAYNPAVPDLIWSREDVQASGEVASLVAGASSFNVSSVDSYHAPTAIIAGQDDGPLCGGDCGDGPTDLLALSRRYFPGVSQEKYFSHRVPRTGHMVHYHESARTTMETVHAWLEKMGF